MKKRILYIGNDLRINSFTVTYISFFSKMLRKEGYEVKTASTRSNKALRLTEMLGLIARYKNSTDIVLIDTYGALNFYYAYLVGKACQLSNLEYIPILHGGNLPERLERSKSFSESLFGSSKVNIAPSMFLKDAFEKHGFQNTKVIPNAIKTSNYPFKRRESFQPKLLWVRRFQERYNPIMAIEVLKIISEKYPQASLCMVGPEKDGTMKTCKKLAEKYDLDVRFTGKLKKKYWSSLSQHYDFFINTTTVDNTPISVIEAMSLGLVVVSTNVGGMPQLIDHSMDGILVQDRSAQQMAVAIQDIVENPEVGVLLCKNAKSKVDEFDWSCVRDDWNQVLA
ncbi:glycosyltransferase involved in cell wall biosynthesis [Gramella sp. Hel_I_59]|uniref:glycosyltransferase family 4 protein n=1 Tax=Gramella sp. Hel_I_59 TaxID=1249978 RepID=UPI001150B70C|nr:glycosyltransferase [Gramella sp. Hel_I_59]TQI71516.1 glycosyltransferase involved in cell wall biosynthesis [Gramella sp. Hel_I_59]